MSRLKSLVFEADQHDVSEPTGISGRERERGGDVYLVSNKVHSDELQATHREHGMPGSNRTLVYRTQCYKRLSFVCVPSPLVQHDE